MKTIKAIALTPLFIIFAIGALVVGAYKVMRYEESELWES